MGSLAGGALGNSGGSSLLVTLEYCTALEGASFLVPSPEPLPSAPSVAPKLTIFPEAQGIIL